MDLWIRSQDKACLVKVDGMIGLKYNDNKTIITNFQPDFTDNYEGYYEVLGTYTTKERALEVLDEIQAMLSPKLRTLLTKDGVKLEVTDKNYDVYEMPEEW